jgi:transcription antitermination factor NusA-like protein
MKTPICDICLKSDILCTACSGKVEKGIVKEDDVESLRKLKALSARIKPLEGIRIKRIVSTADLMLLMCHKGDAGRIIGKGGIIVKNLARAMNKNVRVMEETNDVKTFLEMLVFPVQVLSVGRVFRDSGDITRMRVPSGSMLPLSGETIKDAFMHVFGQEVDIVFE